MNAVAFCGGARICSRVVEQHKTEVQELKRVELVETLIIFISIGSIWPLTLGYTSPLTIGFCLLVIAMLCVIAVRRWRRFKEALEEERKKIEAMTGFSSFTPHQQKRNHNDDGTDNGSAS